MSKANPAIPRGNAFRALAALHVLGLAAKDEANARWKWELAISHGMIGYVQQLKGDLAGALVSYGAYRDLMRDLVRADPNNAAKEHDLTFALMRLGDILEGQS